MGFVSPRVPFAAGFFLIATTAGGQGAERLHMPFDCYFDGFQVQLEPSEDRSYEIIGPRERDILSVCAPYDPGRCRSWHVHRFEFQCGGTRVSWVDAALAGARMTGRDAWLEDGRVHMRMGPLWTIARDRPRRSQRRLRNMPGVNAFDPAEFGGADGANVVTAPQGFAPAFGIPVAFDAAEPGFTADEPSFVEPKPFVEREPSPSEQLQAAQAPAVAAYVEPPPPPQPIPELPERAPSVRPEPAAKEPSTHTAAAGATTTTNASTSQQAASEQVSQPDGESSAAKSPGFTIINAPGAKRSEPEAPPVPDPEPAKAAEVATGAVADDIEATSAMKVADAQETTRPSASSTDSVDTEATTQPQPPVPSLVQPASGSDDSDLASATAAAAAVFALAGLAFFGLRFWRRAGPDNTVPPPGARDFGAISLGTVQGGAAASPRLRAEPQFSSEMGVAELALDGDISIPANYTQALHVLGASADASTDAIKKIVDGLRKSWHPDHARSESDRLYREKRARQINVAWDLISQRRTTTA